MEAKIKNTIPFIIVKERKSNKTHILIKTQEVNTWTDITSIVGRISLQFKCLFSSLKQF